MATATQPTLEQRLGTIETDQRQIIKHLEALSQPRSKAHRPGTDGAAQTWESWDERKGHWSNDPRIQEIVKAYDMDDARVLLEAHRNSRRGPLLSGIGKAAQMLAHVMHPDKIHPTGAPANYGIEQLDEQYGLAHPSIVRTKGVKGLNGQRYKAPLAEAAGVTGGYTVPPQFQTKLLTIAGEDSWIEQRAQILPLTTLTAEWPMLDITTVYGTGITPYGGGVVATWQPEAQVITESEPQFRQGTWTAWTLTMYAVASNQVIQDSAIGLDAFLTQMFSWALPWYKQRAFMQGLGAGSKMPLGVLNSAATISQSRAAPGRFRFQDAAAMMGKLHWRSWPSCTWVMHYSLMPELIQMVDNTSHNQLVWLTPFGSGNDTAATQKFPTVFLGGMPIVFTEMVPQLGTAGDVSLIDWSHYVVGQRMDLQIDVSPHVKFTTNQMVWRVIARADGKPWLNSYITDASGYTSSPFVTMAA